MTGIPLQILQYKAIYIQKILLNNFSKKKRRDAFNISCKTYWDQV